MTDINASVADIGGYATLDNLFQRRLPEDDVTLPGVGKVRVRGLSRLEMLRLEELSGKGTAVVEQGMISTAMLIPAGVTMSMVEQWQDASVAVEIGPVMDMINKLSGTARASDKESYKSV